MTANRSSPRFFWAVVSLCVLVTATPHVGSSQPVNNAVTISVPTMNSFSADRQSFTLTFEDFVQGSVSNTVPVLYTIRANNIQRDRGVIQASLAQSPGQDISVEADVGAYTQEGGNAILTESAAGFAALGTSPLSLCDKQPESGSGLVIRGQLVVSYRAVAQQDLPAGGTQIELTVSLLDA